MFAIIQAAGWPIWPLLLASIIAVALIIERAIVLRSAKILPPGLLKRVIADYQQSGVTDALLARIEGHSPLGRVLAAGMRNAKSSREVMKEAIEEAGRGVAQERRGRAGRGNEASLRSQPRGGLRRRADL